MQRRVLGRTGLKVSSLGFGAWQLGNPGDYWAPMDDRTALRLVAEALDAGVDLFDTAPNYGTGNSERLLGQALAGKRDRVVLVSKFGHRPDGSSEFSVPWFRESLEGTLRRLRTDFLDVLLLHNPPVGLYAREDPIWDALEEARSRGWIRHYGASLDSSGEIEACLAGGRAEVLEVRFNVLHQEPRRAFPMARERGVGIIAKIPLDSGWLTGRFDAGSRFAGVRGRWSPEEIATRADLVERFRRISADAPTLVHLALGFVLSHEAVGCTIPGTRTPEQLRSNLAAAAYEPSARELDGLEAFWEEITGGETRLLPW